MPMTFSNGQTKAITMAMEDPAGFSTANLRFIHEVLPVLSRFYEVHAKRRHPVALMQTFLGELTGENILDEQVKRGDGEDIHAVILFCDLRNSMPILDRMERNAFLWYLNQFFDCIAGAVSDHGGEVRALMATPFSRSYRLTARKAGPPLRRPWMPRSKRRTGSMC